MAIHPLAGSPAPASMLIDVSKVIAAYSSEKPDIVVREQRIAFGTSGHRGSAFKKSFNEWHILTVTQAICDYRAGQGTGGPLYLGKDTHALSEPACANALEVLAANGVEAMIDQDGEYTPRLPAPLKRSSPIIAGEHRGLPTASSLRLLIIHRRTVASSTTRRMVGRLIQLSPSGLRIARMSSLPLICKA